MSARLALFRSLFASACVLLLAGCAAPSSPTSPERDETGLLPPPPGVDSEKTPLRVVLAPGAVAGGVFMNASAAHWTKGTYSNAPAWILLIRFEITGLDPDSWGIFQAHILEGTAAAMDNYYLAPGYKLVRGNLLWVNFCEPRPVRFVVSAATDDPNASLQLRTGFVRARTDELPAADLAVAPQMAGTEPTFSYFVEGGDNRSAFPPAKYNVDVLDERATASRIRIRATHPVDAPASHHLRFAKSGERGPAAWDVYSNTTARQVSDRGTDVYPGSASGTNIRQAADSDVTMSMSLAGLGAAASKMSMWASTVPLGLEKWGLTPSYDLDTFVSARDTPMGLVRTFDDDCYDRAVLADDVPSAFGP